MAGEIRNDSEKELPSIHLSAFLKQGLAPFPDAEQGDRIEEKIRRKLSDLFEASSKVQTSESPSNAVQ